MKKLLAVTAVSSLVALTGCPIEDPIYSAGGNVSGLNPGGQVELTDVINGTTEIVTAEQTSYTITTELTGFDYDVQVLTQPDGQTCAVENSTGTVSTINVTDINVYCVDGEATIYAVGDTGPAGGKVFYTFNGGLNGLEVASENIVVDGFDYHEWGCFGTDVPGADGTAIGTGADNTANILAAGCSSEYGRPIAAELADDYEQGGYNDWFLASKDELNALYDAKDVVGGIPDAVYYSSSQGPYGWEWWDAWNQDMVTGIQGHSFKEDGARVRPVRAFGPPVYAIGDTGPAGGIVFYVSNGGLNGLEAAPEDQDDGTGAEWGCWGTDIPGADGFLIGTGKQNTEDILAACSEAGTAAALADSYTLNGFDDWFLPSNYESGALYYAKDVVGGFADNRSYWCSTEQSAYAAHGGYMNVPIAEYSSKQGKQKVRAVRAF